MCGGAGAKVWERRGTCLTSRSSSRRLVTSTCFRAVAGCRPRTTTNRSVANSPAPTRRHRAPPNTNSVSTRVTNKLVRLKYTQQNVGKLHFATVKKGNTHTHTHTRLMALNLSRTTRVSRYQKGKTNLDFTEARDSEWQWHHLGHMQVCTSIQTDNHASTPPLSFLQAECPSCRPTNSVKALKAIAKKRENGKK